MFFSSIDNKKMKYLFEVYNWSNDDVIHWLVNHVHLSIYVEYFRRNQIDGRMIPRLIFFYAY